MTLLQQAVLDGMIELGPPTLDEYLYETALSDLLEKGEINLADLVREAKKHG